MFIKSFIYLTIIVIIVILNNNVLTQAKTPINGNKLRNMHVSPELPAEFKSTFARIRRDIGTQRAADENYIPKDQFYTGSQLRSRRQTATDEFNGPNELQKAFQLNRAKRQMPAPPGDIPMPPM